MIRREYTDRTALFARPAPVVARLLHNLPFEQPDDAYVLMLYRGITRVAVTLVFDETLTLSMQALPLSASYRMVVFKLKQAVGLVDGLYWLDSWVYHKDQASIRFATRLLEGGAGEDRQIVGRTTVAGVGASRRVFAVAIDDEIPSVIAQAKSDAEGYYQLVWKGYNKELLLCALDDNGQVFAANRAVGMGDRIRPTVPNGFVYQANEAASLGETEPHWPKTEGEIVISGSAVLVAKTYYAPMASGPLLP